MALGCIAIIIEKNVWEISISNEFTAQKNEVFD